MTASTSQPSIDVLIVSFNTRNVLAQTLATLLDHTPAPPLSMQVSVLDNASSDGSAEMVAERFPMVNLTRSEENLGFGKAMNALARASESAYVMLLNSDVIVHTDICTPLVAALDADPQAVVASPRLLSTDGTPQFSANRLPTLRSELAVQLRGTRLGRAIARVFDSERIVGDDQQIALTLARSEPWTSESIWATCWVLRRADIPDGAIFDERFPLYDEDLDFCLRAKQQGRTLIYVPSVELEHLGGASSTQADKNVYMQRGRTQYYTIHGGNLQGRAFSVGVMRVVPKLIQAVAAIPKPKFLKGEDSA